MVSSTEGSDTSTFWKRRARARSFSKIPRNSWNVVEPMQRISPEDNSGLSRFERSEEHTSELQSLMRISYAVFCLKKKTPTHNQHINRHTNKITYNILTHH